MKYISVMIVRHSKKDLPEWLENGEIGGEESESLKREESMLKSAIEKVENGDII